MKELQKQRPIVISGICWDQSGRDTQKEETAKEDDKQGMHNDHFTTAGEVESGKRYAAAMLDILNGAKGLPPAKPTPSVPAS